LTALLVIDDEWFPVNSNIDAFIPILAVFSLLVRRNEEEESFFLPINQLSDFPTVRRLGNQPRFLTRIENGPFKQRSMVVHWAGSHF